MLIILTVPIIVLNLYYAFVRIRIIEEKIAKRL